MAKGIDSGMSLQNCAATIKSQGYDFVCRYYNVNHPSKNLTHGEAVALCAVGLRLVAVWENGSPTQPGYFTLSQGLIDAAAAFTYARFAINQPLGTHIYFAVDYDAAPADVTNSIIPYFRGINQAFKTLNQGNSYIVGVYGSGLVCAGVINAGLAAHAWLTGSTGWNGTSSFKNANIIQTISNPSQLIGGVGVDTDVSPNDNEGSFTVSAV